MADKERIDYLLLDIRELEKLIAGMRNAEMYPVSFFSQSFDLTHKILQELHTLEALQIEFLRRQMEEHQAILNEIPHRNPITVSLVTAENKTEEKSVTDSIASPVAVRKVSEKIQEKENQDIPAKEEKALEDPFVSVPDQNTDIITEHIENKSFPEKGPDKQENKPCPTPDESVRPLEGEEKKTEVSHSAGLYSAPAVTVANKLSTSGVSINEILERKNLSDFRKAFSLNDRFYFRRELFAGDEVRMNQVIADLNDIHSYENSIDYLDKELKWNIDDKAVSDFIKLIEKRFS